MLLQKKEQNFLLKLARKSINYYLKTGIKYEIDQNNYKNKLSSNLLKKRATFVTLTKDNKLRGCIGKLEPQNPIYIDVIENAFLAAFQDFRFSVVKKEELKKIKIEISILTLPKKFEYNYPLELISMLKQKKCGVVLKKDHFQATFLPQVWEELTKVEEFLSHLCTKAGLNKDTWKKEVLEIFTYNVEKFKE